MTKYSIKDIERTMQYFKDKASASVIAIEIDDMHRVRLSTSDSSANQIIVTVYPTNTEESLKMPEITETRRL